MISRYITHYYIETILEMVFPSLQTTAFLVQILPEVIFEIALKAYKVEHALKVYSLSLRTLLNSMCSTIF